MRPFRIAGYAALFDRVDRGNDVIAPGAFAGSLERNGGNVPLLWQHDPARRVGSVTYAREDRRGLRVIGEIDGDNALADLVRVGTVTGLSFGYRVTRAAGQRPRRLEALELVEVSLVSAPMQPLARVHMLATGARGTRL